jgi:hypothetical protein
MDKALELADELENYANPKMEQAATMLRQQQAEIEALKQIIDANNLSQNIGQFVKPAKTLTDEEILQEAWYILATQWQKKAQEK